MILQLIKIFTGLFCFWWVYTRIIRTAWKQYQLQKGGVRFDSVLSPITDLFKAAINDAQSPQTELNIFRLFHKFFGPKLPAINGIHIMGQTFLYINSCHLLEIVYVKRNSVHSKHWYEHDMFAKLMYNAIFLMRSDDPHYAEKRKVLSAAFFKKKLEAMVNTIKFTTIEEMENWRTQFKDGDTIDMVKQTMFLQSRIITNCIFGRGVSRKLIDYEESDGSISQIPMLESLNLLVDFTMERLQLPLNVFFPEILKQVIHGSDRRYARNCERLRDQLRKVLNDRRQQKIKSLNEDMGGDLLSILVRDDLFSKDDESIVDEMISFFFAGSATTQVATTNLIYYMIQQPALKERFMADFMPTLEKFDDFYKDYTMDEADNFDFVRLCFYESLRIEPPIPASAIQMFEEDVQLGDATIKAEDAFQINISYIQRDPEQWQKPNEFIPERFEPHHEMFKRPDGGARHPLAFTAFLGGKRICLGKTFVETMIRFTLPMIFYSFDFDIKDENLKQNKPPYHIGAKQHPKHLMQLYRRNVIKANIPKA